MLNSWFMGTTRYDEIRNAAEIIGLSEKATMETIKRSYRVLVMKWHPDRCGEDPQKCKEMTQKIIEAYQVILDYCNNYEYSFGKEEVERILSPEERWFAQFGDDPLWGSGKRAGN